MVPDYRCLFGAAPKEPRPLVETEVDNGVLVRDRVILSSGRVVVAADRALVRCHEGSAFGPVRSGIGGAADGDDNVDATTEPE